MNYIIYLRKSTESKERQVMSLSAQKRTLLETAEKEQLNIVDVFEESKSALKPGRPQFNKLIKAIEKGKANALLVWDVNRISRNPADSGYITQLMQDGILKEIKTHSAVYLPGDNALPLALNFALSNESSLALGKVVKRGNIEKLKQGGWPNKAPLGYRNDRNTKKTLVHKKESKHVIKAFELYSTGMYSCDTISDILHDDGLRSKAGKKVSKSNIHLLLQKTFYYGTMEWHGKFYKGNHSPIISKKLFDLCENIRTGNNKTKPQTKKELNFSMRGLFRCAECNCMITAEKQRENNYYHCTNGKKICTQKKPYLHEDELEKDVVAKIQEIHFDDELIDLLHEASLEKFYSELDNNKGDKSRLESQLKALRADEDVMFNKMIKGVISDELYTEKSKELKLNIFDLERKIDKFEVDIEKELSTFEQTKKVFKAFNFNDISFFEMKNDKKYKTLKKLLSNSTLKNENGSKTLNLQYKKPYDRIARSPYRTLCPELLPD